MPQHHGEQYGTFHVTMTTQRRGPWLTVTGIPEILIDNLRMTAHLQTAMIHAFCVLPDHLHLILTPGDTGISKFIHSFKLHSSRESKAFVPRRLSSDVTGWQKGDHDELLRDDRQLEQAAIYVQENALKHELVDDPMNWPWSSLHYPDIIKSTSRSRDS